MIFADDYDYHLPSRLIAQEPVSPRDSSRLFIYHTRDNRIEFDRFFHLTDHLPPASFLVLNDTKVLPSRIMMKKQTGGRVKVLFLVNEKLPSGSLRVMVDRKVEVGDRLYFENNEWVTVRSQDHAVFTVSFDFSLEHLYGILESNGVMPIPPYIKHTPLSPTALRSSYQTIFARTKGSSAAPTASLHFTPRVFKSLAKRDIPVMYTTLHVGMGTFAPVTGEDIRNKKLHTEWYEVPRETYQLINQLKQEKRKLVAVGTTVVRTLESYVKKATTQSQKNKAEDKKRGFIDETDLFIMPPYQFSMVDHMITNFHIPGSSLMMLVEAFLQHKKAKRNLLSLYQIAQKEGFRFYSFGDAMLIL